MARRWTPQRFVMLRRIRVAACAATVALSCVAAFGLTARKTVALSVNGETSTVSTYAMSVDRLLEEQGVDVKTHDLVQSTSGGTLANHAVVTVRSAYQTTITIDGQEVPFWTVADSMDQLLGFFESNEKDAAKVTVDIKNIYNQLTGGLVINQNGPVTVIADGKSSVAPDGKLPAASILDFKGIIVGKEDRVSVEKDGDTTILRVRRITHGQETRTKTVPYATRTVIDPNLAPGQAVIRQQGVNGTVSQTYDVTYVDGVAESEQLASQTTTAIAIDQIVAVGPTADTDAGDTGNAGNTGNGNTGGSNDGGNGNSGGGDTGGTGGSSHGGNTNTGNSNASGNGNTNGSGNSGNGGNAGSTGGNNGNAGSTGGNSGGDTGNGGNGSGNTNSGNSGNTNTGNNGSNSGTGDTGGSTGSTGQGRLWHPSVAQAKAYARGAAAQRGWTGAEWDALEWLWTKESGWLWYADNPYSDAYGIPQALPGSKMGPGWQDDGAVQIDWGLSYIAQRYGTPLKCKAIWLQQGWY